MLIKINKKPIHVTEEDDSEGIDYLYLGVTVCGYLGVLSLLDYTSYLFIGKHIFPFITWLTKLLLFIL
jgi:hypothetical protein